MKPELNGVIQRKLALLESQISKLRLHLQNVSYDSFKDDWVLRSMAERAIQVAIEIMIDIAERIIAVKGVGPVATAQEAIKRLVELGMLKKASPYDKMVRFRNLIVHQYADIDPSMLFEISQKQLDDFHKFRDEIDRALHGN